MNNIATLDDIIRSAAQGREPGGFCDLTDYHLHTCLSQLYADYNSGKYDLEQCKALKEKLVNAWKSDKQTKAQYMQSAKDWNAAIVESNEGRTAMRKAETLRDFAVIAAQIIEKLSGETGFVEIAQKLPEVNF